jgi:hypothetical protein
MDGHTVSLACASSRKRPRVQPGFPAGGLLFRGLSDSLGEVRSLFEPKEDAIYVCRAVRNRAPFRVLHFLSLSFTPLR